MKTIPILVLTAVAFAACADQVTVPAQEHVRFTTNGAGRLAVYNAGIDRAVPNAPCLNDERHREFDFWVGSWQMGSQRSLVRSLLDGCMIEENYMPGGPTGPNTTFGRSINAYDRDTGRWHQTWISVFPRGHLRMSGNLVDGVMILRAQGPGFSAEYQWRRIGSTDVEQSSLINGGGSSLLYTPLAGVTLQPPAPFPFCQPGTPMIGGDINRQLDFLLGEWNVQAASGPVLGVASVGSDLNGCVAREDYTTDKGYASHSYIYYDLNTRAWHRTYIDSEAQRIELFGSFANGALVLHGADLGPEGRLFQVRNTIRPIDSDRVEQTWEVSEDGVHWRSDIALMLTRR